MTAGARFENVLWDYEMLRAGQGERSEGRRWANSGMIRVPPQALHWRRLRSADWVYPHSIPSMTEFRPLPIPNKASFVPLAGGSSCKPMAMAIGSATAPVFPNRSTVG